MATDANTRFILIATVIVAAIIIVALIARCRCAARASEHYTVVSPATPLAYNAMARLTGDLRLICQYCDDFMTAGCTPDMPTDAEPQDARALPLITAAKSSVRALGSIAKAAQATIGRTPPSWQNYTLIYRALSGSDGDMHCTAREFIDAGRTVEQTIAQQPGDPLGVYYTVTGDSLKKLGGQIFSFTANVHRLGSALDLE